MLSTKYWLNYKYVSFKKLKQFLLKKMWYFFDKEIANNRRQAFKKDYVE